MRRATAETETTLEQREQEAILAMLQDASAEYPRSGKSIAESLSATLDVCYSGATIRAIVHDMRAKGCPIIGSGRGYYLATSAEECLEHARRLHNRAAKIMSSARAMRRNAANVGTVLLEGF